MARIAPAAEKGLIRRVSYWVSRRRLGKVLDPIAIRAHHQPLLMAYGNYELVFERVHRVDAVTKKLAMARVAMLAGCEW